MSECKDFGICGACGRKMIGVMCIHCGWHPGEMLDARDRLMHPDAPYDLRDPETVELETAITNLHLITKQMSALLEDISDKPWTISPDFIQKARLLIDQYRKMAHS